ncbi:hypothetical protein C8R43DRAFT_352532 [Mycena crocata]|nr:hypothetical protein C8R43DRAFT_352532 [Mycena crocata]
MASTSTFSPVSGPDSAQWAPSMPNSDLYTLLSVKDHLEMVTPAGAQRAPHARRVMAIRTSPLARFPPVSAASLLAAAQAAAVATAAAASTTAATQGLNVSATPSTETTASPPPEPNTASPRTRASIGLGHPSTSSRCMPTSTPSTSSAASSSSASPPSSPASTQTVVSRTRINSSTIKKRTQRFPGRVLNSIAEDATATVNESTFARPVLGVRKRSYAAATTSTTTTDSVPSSPRLHTGRRNTPTPSSPRSAQTTPGNATATTPGTALPPRYTSLGTPLARPSQVMSPRTLVAPYGGSPCFQSLDGAVGSITGAVDSKLRSIRVVSETERVDSEEGIWREVVSEGNKKRDGCTNADETLYREDALLKLRYRTSIKMRIAARGLKTLF